MNPVGLGEGADHRAADQLVADQDHLLLHFLLQGQKPHRPPVDVAHQERTLEQHDVEQGQGGMDSAHPEDRRHGLEKAPRRILPEQLGFDAWLARRTPE
jgi:hypothetical protein